MAAFHAGDARSLNPRVLRAFFASLGHQAQTTQVRKLASVSVFLAWCQREHLVGENPLVGLTQQAESSHGDAPENTQPPPDAWDLWRAMATPYLVELYQSAGRLVSLGVLNHTQVHYIAQLYGHRTPRSPSRYSQVAPAHCTAIGKLLLAHRHEPEKLPVDQLTRYTPQTIDNPRALRIELRRIRRAKIAFNHEEYAPGLACIAVPVPGADGQPLLGLAIGDEPSRLAPPRATWHAQRTAAALSAALYPRYRRA